MAAYCRVSTEKDEQLSSLKNQKEFFEQYAEKTGDTLVKIYADEGISGKSMRRRTAFRLSEPQTQPSLLRALRLRRAALRARPAAHLLPSRRGS